MMRSWAMGAFVLLVYTIGVIAGICSWNIGLVEALNKWQTLIGASTALVAALIGALFIQRQIRTAWQIEEDKRQRKLLAARSVLPLALSALTEYSLACGKLLQRLHSRGNSPPATRSQRFPPLPSELIPLFKEIVEHAPSVSTGSFRQVISELQVLSANLRDMRSASDFAPSNLASYAARCAYLHALSDMLFPYARFEHDNPARAPALKDLEKALLFFGFYRETHDHAVIYRLAAKRASHTVNRAGLSEAPTPEKVER